ncbi:hypothetical protein, partial [Stenotrophomonas maltophilia]|uniref:hypothetical protein n=1 Tax=Stenotrophomonas maltophilia TaxID=40324 RepID=UPI00195423C4
MTQHVIPPDDDAQTPLAATAPDAALAARYGSQAVDVAARWNETIAALLDHRTVRAYLPLPLPSGT